MREVRIGEIPGLALVELVPGFGAGDEEQPTVAESAHLRLGKQKTPSLKRIKNEICIGFMNENCFIIVF